MRRTKNYSMRSIAASHWSPTPPMGGLARWRYRFPAHRFWFGDSQIHHRFSRYGSFHVLCLAVSLQLPGAIRNRYQFWFNFISQKYGRSHRPYRPGKDAQSEHLSARELFTSLIKNTCGSRTEGVYFQLTAFAVGALCLKSLLSWSTMAWEPGILNSTFIFAFL